MAAVKQISCSDLRGYLAFSCFLGPYVGVCTVDGSVACSGFGNDRVSLIVCSIGCQGTLTVAPQGHNYTASMWFPSCSQYQQCLWVLSGLSCSTSWDTVFLHRADSPAGLGLACPVLSMRVSSQVLLVSRAVCGPG